MSDKRYLQKGFENQAAHVVEECGEVLAAIWKTQRWGLDSVNPELAPENQEKNGDWLVRELKDLKEAIERLEVTLNEQHNFVVRGMRWQPK